MDIFIKGNLDGIETALEIENRCSVPIIFLTGDSSNETTTRASFANPVGYLQKPFMDEELEYVIESAMHKHIAQIREVSIPN